ncbi:hypothetical protein GEO21_18855 [Sphingobacterium faecium]|uniref:hypothetical protein n=1 Tax=Sphingobacterium faecium TaxID=34087 RepID=UPI0012929D5F|nr:hypothetical protein [Sphingobacterium faecium]MQP29553.1 hypothetical protein [Sphingobacterium faecium]
MRNFIKLLLCITLFSCNSHTSHNETSVKDTTYVDIKGQKYSFLGQIPDSLRTEEQTKLIKKIQKIVVNHIVVKDNKQVFDLSKEEFLATGIPERYYKMLQRNISDNNALFDSIGITNVDELVRKTKEEYNKSVQ